MRASVSGRRRRAARVGPVRYCGLRVALTHPYSWPEVRRGAERIVVETAEALARRGHDVTVFTAGRTATAPDGDRVGDPDAGVVRTVRLRRTQDEARHHERWFGMRLLPLLTRGRFEVVHSLMPHDAVAAIRSRRMGGHRSVYEELGNPYRRWWATLPDRRARERVARDVDVYGCMSRYSLSVLEAEWGRRGELIPGGVRLAEFAPAPARAPQPTVLFSGAVDERRKGLALLLDAVAQLVDEVPDLRLWVSGPGDPRSLLAAAPGLRRRVELLPLGEARAQGERYGRAWVTALPSVGDSFGLVLLESLACGTPIVVLDDAAPPELVTPQTGTMARPGDAASLADALRRGLALGADPATAARCRSSAAAFDWDTAIAPRLERLYSRTGRADPGRW